MKYRFSRAIQVDYSPLKKFIASGEELNKAAMLEKCSGNISLDLLHYIKELEFDLIGKDRDGELYLR